MPAAPRAAKSLPGYIKRKVPVGKVVEAGSAGTYLLNDLPAAGQTIRSDLS
ncbi:unnamed protein product [marine sediment metagenome]|uniref:Uncharacterized protein n=1 Tax=marine sediment metagenome TaxID=412755 RepID=X1JK78_9ZZZZ